MGQILSVFQNNFGGGELSPKAAGRIDLKIYYKALRKCFNRITLPIGSLERRPGSIFITNTKNNGEVNLLPFIFSKSQAYALEFGANYIRFFTESGIILSGGSPYEVPTPYSAAQVKQLYIVQSLDVLYIAHPDFPLKKLQRFGNTNWTLSDVVFTEPPYDVANSNQSKTFSVTSSNPTTITSSFNFFDPYSVGQYVRIVASSVVAYGQITAVTDAQHATMAWKSANTHNGTFWDWRVGVIKGNNNPSCITFSGNRMFLAGYAKQPSKIDGSVVGDFENFAPSQAKDNLVTDSEALAFTLNSDRNENIAWLAPAANGVAIGSTEGEWLMRPSSLSEGLTPKNVDAKRTKVFGSYDGVMPVANQRGELLFIQGGQKKVCSYAYNFNIDNYDTVDINRFADHILLKKASKIVYQQNPYDLLWVVLEDGSFASCSYNAPEEVLGWHIHQMDGNVESICCIPSASGEGQDIIFLSVKRIVNGVTKRYVEKLAPYFQADSDVNTATFVDSAIYYSGAATQTITGLGHLEGKTVSILANGAATPDKVVTGGAITLDIPVTKAVVGLPFMSIALLNRFESGSVQDSTQDDPKRITKLALRLYNSMGETSGSKLTTLVPVVYRTTADPLGQPLPLASGDTENLFDGGYDSDTDVFIVNKTVFPSTILAILSELKNYEAG